MDVSKHIKLRLHPILHRVMHTSSHVLDQERHLNDVTAAWQPMTRGACARIYTAKGRVRVGAGRVGRPLTHGTETLNN